jgi:hypothetical protein
VDYDIFPLSIVIFCQILLSRVEKYRSPLVAEEEYIFFLSFRKRIMN